MIYYNLFIGFLLFLFCIVVGIFIENIDRALKRKLRIEIRDDEPPYFLDAMIGVGLILYVISLMWLAVIPLFVVILITYYVRNSYVSYKRKKGSKRGEE